MIAGLDSIVYALGALGMVVGVLVVAWLFRDSALDNEAGRFRLLFVVPGFAALSYAAMAADIGVITVGGHAVESARYLDWLVTTPVLVAYAGHVVDVDRPVVLVAAVLDVAMIATGWVATTATGTLKWSAFGASSLAFVLVLYTLFAVYPRRANTRTPERRRLFLRLRNQVGVLWLLYPVIWVASPSGFELVSTLGTAMLVTFMDVAAKVPYTWIVHEHRGIFSRDRGGVSAGTDADAADRETPVPPAD